jgi:hypothetical protein
LGGNELQRSAGQAPSGVQGLLKNTREALLPLEQWAQATLRVWQDYGLNYGKNTQKTLFQRIGFDDVSTEAVASLLGGGLAVWTLVMLFLHRIKAAKRSDHALALLQFDKQCKSLKRPREAAQTPTAWFEVNREHLNDADTQKLKQWLKAYEQSQYARPV